jgi:queuosine precursor transporter
MLHRDISLKEAGADHEWQPKYIDLVACLYICALILTWVCASKIFMIGGLILNASLLIYPLNHIFGDVLTEIYGFNRTRRLIWMGFICGLLFLFFTQMSIALPPPPSYTMQEAFATVNGALPRIVLASYLAYLCCEFTNSFIISKLKIWQSANNFPLRAVASTAGAQFVDSLVFFGLAFAGTMPNDDLLIMMVTGWIAKVVYEVVALPLTTIAVRKLKSLEGIEHFDHYKLKVFKF